MKDKIVKYAPPLTANRRNAHHALHEWREVACCRPIDYAHLDSYTLGDEKAEYDILQLFASHLPQVVNQLRYAAHNNDINGWRVAAHTIKGSAQAVGAKPIAQIAQVAENAAAVHWNIKISELENAVDDVMLHIKNRYARPPNAKSKL